MIFSADGHDASWSTWDGEHHESLRIDWDNEAWTARGVVGREQVEYVLRLAPTWHVRQFLLFRDLEDPDLWLAIDARHRWGEIGGSYRSELDGCADVELDCTPFPMTIPIRRLALPVGGHAELDVISIDVETLATARVPVRYERVDERSWQRTALPTGDVRSFDVDEFGLVTDETDRFRRVSVR